MGFNEGISEVIGNAKDPPRVENGIRGNRKWGIRGVMDTEWEKRKRAGKVLERKISQQN